jgi:hypothetical protein
MDHLGQPQESMNRRQELIQSMLLLMSLMNDLSSDDRVRDLFPSSVESQGHPIHRAVQNVALDRVKEPAVHRVEEQAKPTHRRHASGDGLFCDAFPSQQEFPESLLLLVVQTALPPE